MEHISTVLRQLEEKLAGDIPHVAGLKQFVFPLDPACAFDLLAWLAVQPGFPRFYWQQRDAQQEVAICGAACWVHGLHQAQSLVQRYREYTDLRIWGLNSYGAKNCLDDDPATHALFLPRIEIRRTHNQYKLFCYLYSETSLREDAQWARQLILSLRQAVALPALEHHIVSQSHTPDKPVWSKLIHQALAAIEQQQFAKVVLARKTTLKLDHSLDPHAFLAASRQVNHGCYHFMMAFSPHYAFLGSSPERLFVRHGEQLSTEALAGTVSSGDDDRSRLQFAHWLLADEKNQHENQLVVEDICQRLDDGVSGLHVSDAEIVSLRKVQHLRRAISASLYQTDDVDCLHRLQPTAAVAGWPRQAARHFIAQHEPFDRQWYAGSAGFISAQHSEFTVTLRSAAVSDDQLVLYAGAGIVAGSDPESEWLEIDNKSAGLRTLLNQPAFVV